MAKEAVVGKQVTCANCGWSWSTNDSSPSDKYICHTCGKDNENATLKNGGWLNKYNDAPEAQNGIEGTMGGLTDKGFNYNGAWGGTMAMGGSLPGSVGFTYARTQSPAPSNGPYAKKTKASAQTGDSVVKTDTGGGPDDDYIKLDPTKFSQTTTTGVSEAFDPTNSKWKGQSTEWLQKRIQNAELLVQVIKDAKSLPKNEWKEKYKGASFADVGEGRAQPILPDFYDDYKKKDDAFIQDWSQARSQAKNELLMQSRWTANKEKAKKEALDFLGQYKNQNEFLSSIPTQAAEKYGYTPGELENFNAWDFLSNDAVSKAYQAINSNQGFTLPQDPTNEMTCANGVCTLQSMIGVDFSPLKGKKGVYYDKKTGYTIPQYNPTWLEDNNYEKVGYRKLDPREFPQPGDIAQYTDEGKARHMELVLDNLAKGKGLTVYNNYSQTNDNAPGEGKEVRGFRPGTYQPVEFEKTEYFRLTPEAQQKALSRNPTYLKKVEGKKAFESSEDYKKFMETQEYIKANQEKYNKFNQLNPQDWRNGGRTSAQNGKEMKFYQEGLDWKPKSISKDGGWLNKYEEGGVIEDDMGQWAHPGEITKINSNQITMQGVNYPVLGISDTGDTQMMYPNQDYTYNGESVTEYPMMQPGGKVKFGQKQKPDPFYNPLEYYQYTGKPIKQPWMPGDEKIKISDKRTMNAAANSAIRPNKDLVGGKYDADRISNIASVAKLYGIDPNLLLSIDLQETGFGTIGEDPGSESIGHTKGYNLSDLKTPSKRGSDEDVFDDRYDFFARAYLEKMAEGKRQGLTDSLDIIQNYNGRGIITPKTENKYHGFDMKEIYGVPLPTKGISMKQNPLYGKRIFDLRENVIKQNPDLQRLINLAKPTNKPVNERSQMFQMPASSKKENGGWLNKYE